MVSRSPLSLAETRSKAGRRRRAGCSRRRDGRRWAGRGVPLLLRIWHPPSLPRLFQMLGRADEIRSWGSYTNVPLTPGQEPIPLPSPAVSPKASASALRRVLRRARDGVALNLDEAAIAMAARGDDLADLCASAARVRDAGLESAGRRGAAGRLPITYSRKVFIPLTHLCRDNRSEERRVGKEC